MKKKSIFFLLFCLIVVSVNAQFVFRISGNGLEKPSYMLGTLHVLSGDLLDSIPAFLEAENQCQQLFVESDFTDPQKNKDIQAAGQQLIAMPDGKTISDVLGEERMNIFQERMKELCHLNLADSAAKAFLHYQPYFFTLSLNTMIQMEALQKYPAMRNGTMMDVACIKRAKTRGWKVGNLDRKQESEELAKANEVLSQSINEQADTLMAFLNNFEERKQNILKIYEVVQTMGDYWSAGDYEGFEQFIKSENEAHPAIYGGRNEKWLPIMIDAVKEKPTLFVFGAGHLTGPQGVVRQLREAGYKVEQMKP